MSTILRSGKFIRCFASAARTFLNPHKTGDNNLIQSAGTRPLSAGLSQSWNKYGTQQQADSLEPLLQRLDADVKKFGRLSRRDLDEMLEEIRHKHYVSSSQSLLIIRCCGDLVPEELPEVRTKLVKEIWKILVERGVPMDISHYNALLRVYIENEYNFSPEDFLKELEGKGIQPNRVTYQRLMWRYCQHGDVEGASRILELMRSNQLPLSSAVLDALVLGHARLGDAAGARAVVTAMSSAGLEPTPRTYALLAGCSGARGDTEELKKTLKECVDKEIFLSDKDIMDIIEDCAVGGHEENIEFLLGQMQHSAGYNTDAITLILRLIALGRDNAALQVFRSLSKPANPVSESSSQYQGAFFIKQLIKADRPKDVVLFMCQQLKDDGSIPMSFIIATDSALHHGNQDLALSLFRVLNDSGETIKQHYFWPLIIAQGKKNNQKEIFKLLKMMVEFKTGISGETLRDYIIPNLKVTDPNYLFDRLREQNVPPLMAGKMIVYSLLSENKLKSAAQFTLKYGITNNLPMVRGHLIQALCTASDIDPFVQIIHSGVSKDLSSKFSQNSVNDSMDSADENDGEYPTRDSKFVVGSIIKNFISKSRNVDEILPILLEKLHSNGIGISVHLAEKIQEQLGGNMTNAISVALAKLTAEDLEPKPFNTQSFPTIRRTAENLETIISRIESKGEQTLGLKKKLLLAYMTQKQTDKLEQLMERLVEDKFVFSAGLYATLLEYYSQDNNIDKSLMYYKKIIDMEPDFHLDDLKVMRLISLLITNDKYDEAMEILESQPGSKDSRLHSFLQRSSAWIILNTLAEKGEVEKLNQVFNKLLEKKFVKENNVMLGPLVKVHLIKNDIESALVEFEKICKQYNCTPMKNEVTKKLILMEDATGLQKLTDLSTAVHGEVNSLYDLVFGFVECGRVRQARRILETPGMRTRNQRFNSVCERYAQEGKVDYLEGLLEATRELSHIDRSEVFQQLLNTYIKESNAEKAIGLWTLLQEESETPTDKFLIDLADFLKTKNMDVPFVVPEKYADDNIVDSRDSSKIDITNKPNHQQQKQQEQINEPVRPLWEALQKNNVDEALSLWRKLPSSAAKTKGDISLLIEQLLNANKISDATEVAITSLKQSIYPFDRVLRYLLNSLATNGEVDKIDNIGQHLTESRKKALSFDNRKCNAVVKTGGTQTILDDLYTQINSATDEDLNQLRMNFPTGAMLGILSDQPDILPKYMELVEKYYSKGITVPANAAWIHFVITEQNEKAQNIWNKYLSQCDSILFKKIISEAKNRNSPELLDTLLQYLKSSNKLSHSALGVAFSGKIDVFLKEGKIKEAQQVIQEALSSGCTLENINRSALVRLRRSMQEIGQEFQYEIPLKKNISN